jgi:hypothetical protein
LDVRSIATLKSAALEGKAGPLGAALPSGVDLGDVDVEEADRVGLEAGALGLVLPDVGQPGDAVALQGAVQR